MSCTFIEQFITGFIRIKLKHLELKPDQKGPMDLGYNLGTQSNIMSQQFQKWKNFLNIISTKEVKEGSII